MKQPTTNSINLEIARKDKKYNHITQRFALFDSIFHCASCFISGKWSTSSTKSLIYVFFLPVRPLDNLHSHLKTTFFSLYLPSSIKRYQMILLTFRYFPAHFSSSPKTIFLVPPTTTNAAIPDRFTFRMMLFHVIFHTDSIPDSADCLGFPQQTRRLISSVRSSSSCNQISPTETYFRSAPIRLCPPLSRLGTSGSVREEKSFLKLAKFNHFSNIFSSFFICLPACLITFLSQSRTLIITLSREPSAISLLTDGAQTRTLSYTLYLTSCSERLV